MIPNESKLSESRVFSHLSSISSFAYAKFPELNKSPQDVQDLTHRKAVLIDLLVEQGLYSMKGDLLSTAQHKIGKATDTMR